MGYGPPRIDRDLTTGEVARLTELSQQTVIRACDRGDLRSYRLPAVYGSDRLGNRRITRRAVMEWAEKHGMPLKPLSLVEPQPKPEQP